MKKMLAEVKAAGGEIDDIFFCPHAPEDQCACRKPKPGLLLQAAHKYHINPKEILMIGDAIRDVIAAKSCGAKAIFIRSDKKPEDLIAAKKEGVPIYNNLAEAIDAFCKSTQ